MVRKTLVVAGIALVACSVANAQDYFDFGSIPGVPEQPAVQVDLNPTMIGLFSATARAENPAAADLLAGIEGVRVRVYHKLDNVDEVSSYLTTVASRLERDDWQQVVSVEDEARVRVFIRGNEETITGITAMVVGEAEAVFINVAGSINAEQLAQSVASFNPAAFGDAGQMLAALGAMNPAQ